MEYHEEMSIYLSEPMCNSLCRKYVREREAVMPAANLINIHFDRDHAGSD